MSGVHLHNLCGFTNSVLCCGEDVLFLAYIFLEELGPESYFLQVLLLLEVEGIVNLLDVHFLRSLNNLEHFPLQLRIHDLVKLSRPFWAWMWGGLEEV